MGCRRAPDPDHPYKTATPVPLYSSLGLRWPDGLTRGTLDWQVRDARMTAQHHFEQWGDEVEVLNARGKVLFRAGRKHDYDEMLMRKYRKEPADD